MDNDWLCVGGDNQVGGLGGIGKPAAETLRGCVEAGVVRWAEVLIGRREVRAWQARYEDTSRVYFADISREYFADISREYFAGGKELIFVIFF